MTKKILTDVEIDGTLTVAGEADAPDNASDIIATQVFS